MLGYLLFLLLPCFKTLVDAVFSYRAVPQADTKNESKASNASVRGKGPTCNFVTNNIRLKKGLMTTVSFDLTVQVEREILPPMDAWQDLYAKGS
jgi:hypothetical protein